MKTYPSFGYSVKDIANWFTCQTDREAGDLITHLKLQKLVYYAQAWALALFQKSLFEEEFEAWAHGPVAPVLYEEYRHYGYEALPSNECDKSIVEPVELLLKEVMEIYGQKSAKYLEELTHIERPWMEARNGLSPEIRSKNIIFKESMEKYYTTLLSKDEQD